MAFSDRYGIAKSHPPRDHYEDAPQPVRALLFKQIKEADSMLQSYHRLCDLVGLVPDSDIWSEGSARAEVLRIIEHMDWNLVFDALEDIADGSSWMDDDLNKRFAQTGMAYEMVDGQIYLHDEEAAALDVAATDQDPLSMLDGRFKAVRKQYEKARTALHGRPADLEKAVSESFGALEAVAHILTGKKDFAKAIEDVLEGREGMGALSASLKSMYGYASQVPGARHGRHKEPDLTFAEAKLVVKLAGIAIAYLIETTD